LRVIRVLLLERCATQLAALIAGVIEIRLDVFAGDEHRRVAHGRERLQRACRRSERCSLDVTGRKGARRAAGRLENSR